MRKQDYFRIVENDNFGAYQKIKREKFKAFLFPPEVKDGFNYQLQDSAVKQKPETEKNDVVVLLNNLELDQMRVQESLDALVEDLEKQKPAIIVVFGNFISKQNADIMSFEEIQELLGYFGGIVR